MMKTISIREITWTVEALPEHEPIEGNCLASGDEALGIRRSLAAGNVWAWCCVRVTGRWHGIEATDYLGCCSYKSEKNFCRKGGYFDDMKNTVRSEIQNRAAEIFTALNEEAVCS